MSNIRQKAPNRGCRKGVEYRLRLFLRDFAVSVAVGMILLLLLSRLIDRVQFSLSTAFWCSLIGHSFLSVVSLFMGFLFARQRSDFSLPWPLDASSRRSCSKSPFAQRMA